MSGVVSVDVSYHSTLHSFFYGASCKALATVDTCSICGQNVAFGKLVHCTDCSSLCMRCHVEGLAEGLSLIRTKENDNISGLAELSSFANYQALLHSLYLSNISEPRKAGQPIRFGQLIQLRHIRSNRLLSLKVNPSAGASMMEETYVCELEKPDQYLEGSQETWFQVIDIRREKREQANQLMMATKRQQTANEFRERKDLMEMSNLQEIENLENYIFISMPIALFSACLGSKISSHCYWNIQAIPPCASAEDAHSNFSEETG